MVLHRGAVVLYRLKGNILEENKNCHKQINVHLYLRVLGFSPNPQHRKLALCMEKIKSCPEKISDTSHHGG